MTRPGARRGLAAALVATALVLGAAPRGPETERWTASGLRRPVEVLVDRWGVPHVYASDFDDLFFAQGWNAARDRLWQLDLWRRRGEGRLAEVFGPRYVEQDRAARLFLYRGGRRAEWLAYGSDTKRVVTAFVAGINAFVELTEREPELLDPAFERLGYRPGRWTPETVVRLRSHGLLRNATAELRRALLLRDHGPLAIGVRERFEPARELQVPEGLDLDLLSDAVLDLYRLGTGGVDLDPGDGALAREGGEARDRGSNNWAVSPRRTATGRPLLANDPHRTQAVPSLRYIAHLSGPGLDVIGAGEPALPGVSIGHNGRVAFGLTIFSIDQEDLYVYRTRPGAPDEYRYRDRWEPMERVLESVPVHGADAEEVELRFTRHGPVIWADPEHEVAVALRAAWLEPGMAPYLGSLEYMRARSWDDFLAAMNRWGLPSENQVYADTDGHVGWKPGGLAPIRPNWDGLLPVPGDGRYEWAGFRDADELPQAFDPERGWVATANEMNLPEGYAVPLGYEWALEYRAQRIAEVLGADDSFSVADALRLQTDYVSVPARRVQALLRGRSFPAGPAEQAAALLRGWDGVLGTDSAGAALFEIWFDEALPPALLAAIGLGPEAREAIGRPDAEAVLALLERPDARLGADPEGTRDALLAETLAAAWAMARERLGADPGAWRWGALHRIELRHLLTGRLPGLFPVLGPLPRGGDGYTVGATFYRWKDPLQTSGASFRMVLDVGAWDGSVAMNSPGQSGDPRSPHYADLFPRWAADEAFPLVYSRGRVLSETERRMVLVPAP